MSRDTGTLSTPSSNDSVDSATRVSAAIPADRKVRWMQPDIVPGHDGLPLAVWDLAGSPNQPTALVLHATGFHSICYRALAETLGDRYHVVGLDFRGHGRSATPD